MKEISIFRYRNLFERKISQNKINPTWSHFLTAKKKIPRKLFEFMTSWVLCVVVVALYLKFREAGNEAGDVRQGFGVENIISVNYDETNNPGGGGKGHHHRQGKVSDKWGAHEL